MATESTGDGMASKLETLYPASADSIGDRYMQWVADHGPEWEDIVAYVETQSASDMPDAWNLYWTS